MRDRMTQPWASGTVVSVDPVKVQIDGSCVAVTYAMIRLPGDIIRLHGDIFFSNDIIKSPSWLIS